MEQTADYAATAVLGFVGIFLDPSSFLSAIPVCVALLIATVVLQVRLSSRPLRPGQSSIARLFNHLFPRRILSHASARNDVLLVFVNEGLLFFLRASAVVTSALVTEGLTGQDPGDRAEAGFLLHAVFTLYMVLAWDFAGTYAHYLKHRVPLLWEFHKVHHSASVLTPLTALRRHPLEALFSDLFVIAVLGVAMAAWIVVFGAVFSTVTIFGTLAGIYAWRLLGYNLRHSHVWISYGPFWGRIFISPAQHQVHHSNDPRHYDRNFGHIFAIWDLLLGTLYVPAKGERVRFGIDPEDMKAHQTLGGLLVAPFVGAARLAKKGALRPSSKTAAAD